MLIILLALILNASAQEKTDQPQKNKSIEGIIRPACFATGLSYDWVLSQDGERLAVLGYPDVKVFSIPQFEEISSFPRQGGVQSLAFLKGENKMLLAVPNVLGNQSKVVDWQSGESILKNSLPVKEVSWTESVSENLILLGRQSRADDPMVTLWDHVSDKIVWQMPDKARYMAKAWTVVDEETVMLFDQFQRWKVVSLDGSSSLLSVNANWVFSLGDKSRLLVRLHGKTHRAHLGEEGKIELGEAIGGIPNQPIGVSRDGSLVAVETVISDRLWSSRDVVVINTKSGEEVGRIKDPRLDADNVLTDQWGGKRPYFEVQFIPESSRLMLGTYGKAAMVYDWRTGKPISFERGHQGDMMHARFIENGDNIVSVGLLNQELRVWDGHTFDLLERKPFSYKGRVISTHPAHGRRVLMRLGPGHKIDSHVQPRYQIIDLDHTEYPPFELEETNHHRWKFHWPNDQEIVAIANHSWLLINIFTGKVIDRGELSKEKDWWTVTGVAVNETGSAFYRYGGGRRGSVLTLSIQEMSERKTRELGKIDPGMLSQGDFHLIPDGKHVAWGTSIFERDPFKIVSRSGISNQTLMKQQFSRDGSMYVVAFKEQTSSAGFSRSDIRGPTTISLHKTIGGETLHTWKGVGLWVDQLDISTDMKRVIVTYNDGTLQLLKTP